MKAKGVSCMYVVELKPQFRIYVDFNLWRGFLCRFSLQRLFSVDLKNQLTVHGTIGVWLGIAIGCRNVCIILIFFSILDACVPGIYKPLFVLVVDVPRLKASVAAKPNKANSNNDRLNNMMVIWKIEYLLGAVSGECIVEYWWKPSFWKNETDQKMKYQTVNLDQEYRDWISRYSMLSFYSRLALKKTVNAQQLYSRIGFQKADDGRIVWKSPLSALREKFSMTQVFNKKIRRHLAACRHAEFWNAMSHDRPDSLLFTDTLIFASLFWSAKTTFPRLGVASEQNRKAGREKRQKPMVAMLVIFHYLLLSSLFVAIVIVIFYLLEVLLVDR